MFQQTPRADGAGKGSVFYQGMAALGAALGILAAITATPIVFRWGREPLLVYLTNEWGHKVGVMLLWVCGGVEGFIIYIGVKLIFTSLTIWGMAALAARRFPAG